MLLEDLALAREDVGTAPDVPVIGPARGHLEGDLLAAAADHELGPWLLHGLGHQERVVELVVAPLEGRAILGPQHVHDLAGLVEALEPLAHRVEGDAVGLVLVFLPARTHAADEPAARDDVDVGGHLGEDGGMTIGVPGHDGADAHARGQSREGGEGRPGFQHVADPVGSVRHEVIGDAGSVPATRLIRVAPEIEDVVPRGAAHAGEDREAHACSFEVAG